MPSNSVTRARAPRLRYTAANAACEQQQASLAELQQQKQQVLSLRDAELAEAREAMQRAVAEKERYKVAPKLTPSTVIQLPCHASLPPQVAALSLASPYTHMPGGGGSVSPAAPIAATANAAARAGKSEERLPSFM